MYSRWGGYAKRANTSTGLLRIIFAKSVAYARRCIFKSVSFLSGRTIRLHAALKGSGAIPMATELPSDERSR